MAKFFTSDQHFDHTNIIKFCDRPFESVNEMNETLITNHNEVVGQEDEVYMLGDVIFRGSIGHARSLVSRLNGKLYLVQGNHDKLATKCKDLFQWIRPIYELTVQDPDCRGNRQLVVLCHYAMRVWNRSHHGTFHLYGHSHGGLPEDPNALSFDVGVDSWDYKPVSYEQVKQRMLEKKAKMEEK